MNVILKEGFEYIPEWQGNKKRPTEEQGKVKFRFLSGASLSEVIGADGKADGKKEWLIICEEVTGFTANGEKITPEMVYDRPGLLSLYLELRGIFNKETAITEDVKKKS